jgi:hypothetical protein
MEESNKSVTFNHKKEVKEFDKGRASAQVRDSPTKYQFT